MKLHRFDSMAFDGVAPSPDVHPLPVLHGDADIAVPASLPDFWAAAFSRLNDDFTQGMFAQWMVGTLLGLPMRQILRAVGDSHGEFALPGRVSIEVRAAGVLDSWDLAGRPGRATAAGVAAMDPGKIVFSGLQHGGAAAVPMTGLMSGLFVFCFQAERDPHRWNAWDLSQWEFYVVPKSLLSHVDAGNSITLARLRALRMPMGARRFQAYMAGWLKDRAAHPSSA
jgi:hypothetical protein